MRTVGIVEDHAPNRLLLSAILGARFALREHEDGASALEAFRREPPDVVLLDISLPRMDGIEVLRRMREDPALQAVPVVALTAHAMDEDRARFLAAGFDEYVAKPIVDFEGLVALVERLAAAPRRAAG